MDENGRISVRELQTDGTSTETDYNPDGSGSTVTIDAAGNVTGESTIEPVPPPVPREFEPDKFLSDAQRELPPDIGGPVFVGTEPESPVLTDAEVDVLSGRGIAPIGDVAATDLDDATVGAAFTGVKAFEGAGVDRDARRGSRGSRQPGQRLSHRADHHPRALPGRTDLAWRREDRGYGWVGRDGGRPPRR